MATTYNKGQITSFSEITNLLWGYIPKNVVKEFKRGFFSRQKEGICFIEDPGGDFSIYIPETLENPFDLIPELRSAFLHPSFDQKEPDTLPLEKQP